MGRLTRLVVATALAGQLVVLSMGAALGFTGFGPSSADATFGRQMTFRVDLVGGAPQQVELLLRFAGSESTLIAPARVAGDQAEYVWDAAKRYVTPNTQIQYQWRATDGDRELLSSEQTLLYDDDRPGLDWHSAVIGQATVHWYGGSEGVARRFGTLSAEGASRAEQLLQHQMVGPVDIFVYDSRDDFFGALGPGAREWFGAATFPQVRTIFMWLGAGSRDYLETTIVHEVTHVVFHDATDNPFHEPAKWINEGFATWSEHRSADEQRAIVQAEADSGGLFSFDAIAYDFPFGSRGSSLSYAMGTSMIDMLISKYGEGSIARLAGAYRGGASDDEALSAASGVSADRLFADYYDSFGADEPHPVAAAPLPPSNVRKPGAAQGSSQPGVPNPTAGHGSAGDSTLGWVVVLVAVVLVIGGIGATVLATRRVRGDRSGT
ncbi:MAG TPA: peptidase MA family metallohydrolase [Candidatus Limnocylindria bacterium]|nr:peptidase MA family metallohydrolase [Candidatus Limnocylindria bacterium]